MKVGFIGCGKLGLPCALSVESKGHQVIGYDVDEKVYEYVSSRKVPYREKGVNKLLKKTEINMASSVDEVIKFSDIVFVAVQTPHNPKYEGTTRLPEKRVGFNYSYLIKSVKDVAESANKHRKHITLIIISTVLPGTVEKYIKPLLNKYTHLCYNPFFIAMGTTIDDFEKPEFVLLGCDDEKQIVDKVKRFYSTIHKKSVFETSIINAELIKVVYNTYISSKIAFINTIMEVCHKVGADVDAVSDALELATVRVVSSKYMRGGMGDGGGCHPRDNIALSWLARELDLSYDYFEHIMIAREKQTEWLADILFETQKEKKLPIVILGKAFKKGTNLTVGSPTILLANILQERPVIFGMYDPWVDKDKFVPLKAIYFVGMNHDEFKNFDYPKGSVVLDPWAITKDKKGVEVVRIGRS